MDSLHDGTIAVPIGVHHDCRRPEREGVMEREQATTPRVFCNIAAPVAQGRGKVHYIREGRIERKQLIQRLKVITQQDHNYPHCLLWHRGVIAASSTVQLWRLQRTKPTCAGGRTT